MLGRNSTGGGGQRDFMGLQTGPISRDGEGLVPEMQSTNGECLAWRKEVEGRGRSGTPQCKKRAQGLARRGNVQEWGCRYWLGGEGKISCPAILVLGGVCVCVYLQACVIQVCDFVWRPKVTLPPGSFKAGRPARQFVQGILSQHLPWNCHTHPAFTWVLGTLSKLQCPCLWGECFNYWETSPEPRPWKLWLVRLNSLYFYPFGSKWDFYCEKVYITKFTILVIFYCVIQRH